MTSIHSLLLILTAPAICLISSCSEAQQTVGAPEALVKRLTPQFAERVCFALSEQATQPIISAKKGKLLITAADPAECIRAYGYYLRQYANVHLSQNGDNVGNATFVLPENNIVVPKTGKFNYAYNYCTLSYTGAHWDQKRWERELDLLALSGYKYVLVTSGLERVWELFLQDLNYPKEKISQIIANPVFSAWWHMGNLEGEGDPVHRDIIENEAKLGRFIVSRLREMGMEPVLQGYVGFLPHDMQKKDVGGHIIPQGKWCGVYNRPAILQPTDPAFQRVAALWYKRMAEVYGYTAKYFGGDLFHEGGRKGNTPLTEAAQCVQKAMLTASPQSTWLIQAWGHNPDKRLVAGTDPKHTIILALDKNMMQKHQIARNYQNRPHVWCELANFGGNHGMYGGFGLLETMPEQMGGAIGIGLLSEGLETNPLYYDLLTERISHQGPIDRQAFLTRYASSRYGVKDHNIIKALNILADTVYKPIRLQEGCQESILCARPSLRAVKASTWAKPGDYYDKAQVVEALRLMLEAGKKHGLSQLETYRYDLTDLCRQVLADRARVQLPKCKAAYDAKDLNTFKQESQRFLELIEQTAKVLATNEHFLLGPQLAAAERRAGATPEAQKQMSTALKQIYTTWTDKPGSTLNDYAHRQLAELMTHYYLPRWKTYFEVRELVLQGQNIPGEGGDELGERNENNGIAVRAFREKSARVDAIEQAFHRSPVPRIMTPQGDIMKLAEEILP